MSTRAIRRLREEREKELEGEKSESEEEEEQPNGRRAAFLAMVHEESSSDESDDDDEDSDSDGQDHDKEDSKKPHEELKKMEEPVDLITGETEQEEEEEDLDALLAEFESQDQENISSAGIKGDVCSWFAVIVAGMDARDLDIDFVMRTSLLGGTDDAPPSRGSRRSARQCLFGAPRDEWAQHRPPHYVGGGLGMTSYADNDASIPKTPPWPYNHEGIVGKDEMDLKRWFTFLRSDTYTKDCQDYERIQQTGDVNALALFVAHHPFVIEALLQLCMVLYQTNQSQEGLAMLRRCLWIYECSSLTGFAPLDTSNCCFMDYDQIENKSYFHALFRLVQVSGVAGCIRTSLAVSRYLLSLDPLRDPMGVLLLLDYYALATISDAHDHFVVDLVESQRIQIHYLDSASQIHHQCDLVDLPNWSYSYALALYRLHESSEEISLDRANEALQAAIRKFPAVVEMLLDKNEVDVTGRSFQTDWPSVLGKLRRAETVSELDPSTHRSACAACGLMIRIFVQRNFKLWSSNHVVKWLYDICVDLPLLTDSKDDSIKAAFIRYRQVDPADYEDRFRTLPQDANPLDPMLVGPALAIDPNRRR